MKSPDYRSLRAAVGEWDAAVRLREGPMREAVLAEIGNVLRNYCNRRLLAVDPETDEQRQEIVDALERVTPWLELSEPEVAERLRGIAAMMMDGGASTE